MVTDDHGAPYHAVGTRASVSGEFPAHFTMPLYTPPPDDALVSYDDGNRAGMAYVLAVKPGTLQGRIVDGSEIEPDVLGASTDYVRRLPPPGGLA